MLFYLYLRLGAVIGVDNFPVAEYVFVYRAVFYLTAFNKSGKAADAGGRNFGQDIRLTITVVGFTSYAVPKHAADVTGRLTLINTV